MIYLKFSNQKNMHMMAQHISEVSLAAKQGMHANVAISPGKKPIDWSGE
jgi:hypothetical protein